MKMPIKTLTAYIGLFVNTLISGVSIAYGADWPGTGIYEAVSADSFVNSDDPETPFVFGEGLLLYTGVSETVATALTFNPENNRPFTLRITDPAATLTLEGPVTQKSGSFIKDGPGTLVLAGAGNRVLGIKRESESKDGFKLCWDEETGACTNYGYAVFTVNDGRMVVGAPGQTNTFSCVGWIGSRMQKTTALDIIGGKTDFNNNWFCISRGTGRTDNDVTCSVNVSNGADVVASQICMNNSNGEPNYYGRSFLTIDDAAFSVRQMVFVGEGTGEPVLTVRNGGVLTVNRNTVESGLEIGRSSTAKSSVIVDNGRVGTFASFIRQGSSLTVKNGGVFQCDRTISDRAVAGAASGAALVDGGTICPYSSNVAAEWFNFSTNVLSVGPGGVTFDAPVYSCLGMPAVAAVNANDAVITKTGSGTLAMPASDLPVNVTAGRLRMAIPPRSVTNGLTGALTLAEGTSLAVSGDMALGAMAVGADAAVFEASGLERFRTSWTCKGFAKSLADGTLCLSDYINNSFGTATLINRLPVDRSFELAFEVSLYSTTSRAADGFSVFFHNTDAADAVAGNTAGRMGYADGNITNSFAVGIDVYNSLIRFGTNGQFSASRSISSSGLSVTAPWPWEERRRCRLIYDAAAKTVTFNLRQANGAEGNWTVPADFAAITGSTSAWLSFGAGCGGSTAKFHVSGIRFTDGVSRGGIVRVGGNKTLEAGGTFAAEIDSDETENGFLMGSLAYADGGRVHVETRPMTAGGLRPPSLLTTADTNVWTLSDGAYWKGPDALATSSRKEGVNTRGYAETQNFYPIGGNWNCSFGLDLGERSTPPADAFIVEFRPPSGGLGVEFRYYEDVKTITGNVTNTTYYRTTQVKLLRRGSVDSAQLVRDAAPIDVVKNGPARVSLDYDDQAKTLTVLMTQQNETLSNRIVFTNVDTYALCNSNAAARIRFSGNVGGSYSENICSNFVFHSDVHDARLARADDDCTFFGFDRLAGSGTLVKTGSGDFGLVSDAGTDTRLRIEEGGLVLRKEALENVTVNAAAGWSFQHRSGCYLLPGGFQIGERYTDHRSTAQTRRRVRVDGPWRCAFSMSLNGDSPADAFSVFLHNDPRGNQCVGGATQGSGYTGIMNGCAIGYYFYPYNTSYPEHVGIAATSGGSIRYDEAGGGQSYLPIKLPGKTTDFEIRYDPMNHTLTSIMTQGALCVTNVFTGLNVTNSVKDTFAWLGVGVGCGGSTAVLKFTNFTFEQLDPRDTVPDTRYLAAVDVVSDTCVKMVSDVPDATFRLADTVTLAPGKTFGATSKKAAATLAVGALALGGDNTLKGDGASVLSLNTVSGVSDSALMLDAITLAPSEESLTDRTYAATDVYLSNGAKLAVPDKAIMTVERLYVDGVRQPAGVYTSAKAPWVVSGTVVMGGGSVLFLR